MRALEGRSSVMKLPANWSFNQLICHTPHTRRVNYNWLTVNKESLFRILCLALRVREGKVFVLPIFHNPTFFFLCPEASVRCHGARKCTLTQGTAHRAAIGTLPTAATDAKSPGANHQSPKRTRIQSTGSSSSVPRK